jgi:hypothetical protein
MKLYEIAIVAKGEFVERTVWEVDGRGDRHNRLPRHLIDMAHTIAKAVGGNEVRIYLTTLGRLTKTGLTPQTGYEVYSAPVV